MAAPVAKSASVELWNQLVGIGDDDAHQLDRVIFQLRGLVARSPTDLLACLGLAYGMLLRGNRPEAMQFLERVCRDGWKATYDERVNLAALLIQCGRLDVARGLLDPLLAPLAFMGDGRLCSTATKLAMMSGDLEMIDRISACTGMTAENVSEFRADIAALGLEECFRVHQATAMAVLEPNCCAVMVILARDPDEGHLSLLVDVFTDLPADKRFDMYRLLDERIPSTCRPIEPYVAIGINGARVQPLSGMAA